MAGTSTNRFTATTLETPEACVVQFQNKRKINTPCGELLWVLETGWFKKFFAVGLNMNFNENMLFRSIPFWAAPESFTISACR